MVSPEKLRKLQERLNKSENAARKQQLETLFLDDNDSYVIDKYLKSVTEMVKHIQENTSTASEIERKELEAIDSNASALINAINRHMDNQGWL